MRPSAFSGACLLVLAGTVAVPSRSFGQESEIQYLSGTGKDDRVTWDFRCSSGRRCGAWAEIPVPSQWELEGFGTFAYGRTDDRPHEVGEYRTTFEVPRRWRNRAISLVFEGVMTDAEVRVNGRLAGPVHQGAFTAFSYEIGELLALDSENRLEVRVLERSADGSVTRAERDADYWVFGGIYRPVYLRADPSTSIQHVAWDARHDGVWSADIEVRGEEGGLEIQAEIRTLDGKRLGDPVRVAVPDPPVEASSRPRTVRLDSRLQDVVPWSGEDPHRYRLHVTLSGPSPSGGHGAAGAHQGPVRHRVDRTIGFRTVQVGPDGFQVNGRRVLLRGVNRHAFWPTSGRTLDADTDRRDVDLIERLNFNAVRMSHYPPDRTFLEAADRAGLYVIDELPGWHDAYGTGVGRRLVAEMVRRDVHHPSIIAWANGNEGGWNPRLDGEFGRHDPQARPVLRPDADFGGIDTEHYPTWEELRARLEGRGGGRSARFRRWLRGRSPSPVMPTEMLHALYDGGGGAGLATYWDAIRTSPRGAGGFLWALLDEAVVRGDRGGALDAWSNFAPDGIVGPFRALEDSAHAVRRIFAPVGLTAVRSADGRLGGSVEIENRFSHIDLAACSVRWWWLDLPSLGGRASSTRIRSAGTAPLPSARPGAVATLPLSVDPEADALRLAVLDPAGRTVDRRVFLMRPRTGTARTGSDDGAGATRSAPAVSVVETGDRIVLETAAVEVQLDRRTGGLRSLRRGSFRLDVLAGPRPVGGLEAQAPSVRIDEEGRLPKVVVETVGGGDEAPGLQGFEWRLTPNGGLDLTWRHGPSESAPWGVAFDLPHGAPTGVHWLGEGPARVWGNRPAGGVIDVHTRRGSASVVSGAYAGVVWATLETPDGPLGLSFESDDLVLGVGRTVFPDDARGAVAARPDGDFQVLHRVAPIGTKFHMAEAIGPVAPRPSAAAGHIVFSVPPAP